MIEVRGISKSFGTMRALDDVSFSLDRGEILGFLGPNGAGKSTTMKIITTFLAADQGQVKVDGIDVLEQPLDVRRRIGYLPENVPLYLDMNVHEYLTFVGQARGLSAGQLRSRLDWCIEECGLRTEYKKNISELSKGFKQRTGLAQALIHDPEILILDEPTSGLDPLQILGIRELIRRLAGEKTIIFSTHILQEVSPVTDRVVIINEGRIIADGNIADLSRDAMGTNRVFVGIRQDADTVEAALRELSEVTEVHSLPVADGCRFEVRGPFESDLVGAVDRLARDRSWDLTQLHEATFSLEDTFISLTRRSGDLKGVA
ncbi:MAG: ATP-binding cassette domain-containing protein [Candidatus Krumholzibacteria bacterium]|nr:ATP-binding cassette domain-containing protein [Candidatus Krumholzibacteria bacterium]